MTPAIGIRLTGALTFAPSKPLLIENLDLPGGSWTCLLGPSGVGKSTLLRLIAGLPATGGFEGSIDTSTGQPLLGRIAYMAQSDLLASWLTVKGNVSLGSRLRGEPRDDPRCEAMIERVGLRDHLGKYPPELSGGMRQRVALARTLMEDRPVALLDEPFSALDARTRSEMQELAADVLSGKTVLMVTHDPAEAIRLGDRIYLMTGQGTETVPVPDLPPPRPIDDTDGLTAQANLLLELRRAK